MNMSGESLLIILFVGLVAGWLAGQIVQGLASDFLATLLSESWAPLSEAGCSRNSESISVLD
jgi:hypothetical protein